MGSVNKVLLLGRLGQDMELRSTPNGDAVGNVTMATSETWKDKNTGDRKEKTEWHRLVIWGRRAEGRGRRVGDDAARGRQGPAGGCHQARRSVLHGGGQGH